MPRLVMRYIIALFCSPLACLLALRPGAAILNAILWVGAFFAWLFFAVPGIVLWLLCVIHAWITISSAKADRRADRAMRAYREGLRPR